MVFVLGQPSSQLGLPAGSTAASGGGGLGGGSTVTAFNTNDLFVGGLHGYAERIKRTTGDLVGFVRATDDVGHLMEVWGESVGGDGSLYLALRPLNGLGTAGISKLARADATQQWFVAVAGVHDVVWIPDGSGVLVASEASGVLTLSRYTTAGSFDTSWTLATDTGWAGEPVKIDVACDSATVFYAMQHRTIFRFDISTGLQGTAYLQLPVGSDFVYGGLRVVPGESGDQRDTIVAMTVTGDGPVRAVALDRDRTSLWADETHPSGSYRTFKRKLADGTGLLSPTVQLDPWTRINDLVSALAAYYNPCASAFPTVYTSAHGG